jgi:hypothetical protein
MVTTPPQPNQRIGAGHVQYGLRQPDGHVVWPPGTYKERPLATGADRAALLEALRVTADDLGFPREVFLAHYGWASRVVHDGDSVPLEDPQALAGEPLLPDEAG